METVTQPWPAELVEIYDQVVEEKARIEAAMGKVWPLVLSPKLTSEKFRQDVLD